MSEEIVGDDETFDVHIYAIVRCTARGIKAPDMLTAIERADQQFDFHELFRPKPGGPDIEYAEAHDGYLVDVVGDEEYSRSRAFHSCENNFYPILLKFAELMRDPDSGITRTPALAALVQEVEAVLADTLL